MIVQNHKKSKKFKFDKIDDVDFSWDITPGELSTAKEPVYSRFLKNVYRYDPPRHNVDRERLFEDDSD